MMMRAGSLIQFIHMTSTWPGLRYCPDTCLEQQRDTANYFSHASRLWQGLHPVPPNYEASPLHCHTISINQHDMKLRKAFDVDLGVTVRNQRLLAITYESSERAKNTSTCTFHLGMLAVTSNCYQLRFTRGKTTFLFANRLTAARCDNWS
jgi:hypothetical protein